MPAVPRLPLALAAAIAAAIAAAGPAGAQVARLQVIDPPDSVRIGHPLRVLLTIRPPAGSYPILPAPPPGAPRDSGALRLGDAVVAAFERRPPAFAGGARLDSAVYTVAVFSLDSAVVGPVPVQLVAGGDTALVQAAPLLIRVSPTTTPADSLRPPGPPLDLPRAWGPLAIAVALALLGTALAARALGRRRRRPPRPAPHAHLPPYEQALARIDALDRADVDTAAAVEAHHVELADALRTYLERAHGIDAHRLTTAGLLARMERAGLTEASVDAAADVLRDTDLVKFAASRPDRPSLASTRDRAREALAAMRPAPDPAPA